jgi:hypothetical protein
MKRVVALSLLAAGTMFASPSFAAPCAGFTDVDSADGFCPFVEWVKNRNITLGCGNGTTYCPDANVLRSQMAAFMNRLGNALEPKFLYVSQAGQATALNNANRMCVTTAFPVTGYPRVASPVGSMMYATASSGSNWTARLVYSTDGGTVWNNWSNLETTGGSANNVYTSMSPTANAVILDVGMIALFAIQPTNFASIANDAGCALTVRLDSHTGASSPF